MTGRQIPKNCIVCGREINKKRCARKENRGKKALTCCKDHSRAYKRIFLYAIRPYTNQITRLKRELKKKNE